MEMYGFFFNRDEDVQHHGIKGMKWGVRRFQNENGSLTPLGKKRLKSKEIQKVANAAKNISNYTIKKDGPAEVKQPKTYEETKANADKAISTAKVALDVKDREQSKNEKTLERGAKFAKSFLESMLQTTAHNIMPSQKEQDQIEEQMRKIGGIYEDWGKGPKPKLTFEPDRTGNNI